MGKGTRPAGCGQLQARAERTARSQICPEKPGTGNSPCEFPSFSPPPKRAAPKAQRGGSARLAHAARRHCVLSPPAAAHLTSRGGAYPKKPLLTLLLPGARTANQQPRRRRPAFELGTATSCCLASTQCNAVCLSTLRHKGTAILWLSWTCTKMPGSHRAAACAIELPFISSTRIPKRGRKRRGKNALVLQVSISLFSVFLKIPIFKVLSSVIKWLPLKLPVPAHKQLHYAISNHPKSFRVTAKMLMKCIRFTRISGYQNKSGSKADDLEINLINCFSSKDKLQT